MTADRYDPFKDESLGQKQKRKSPIRIDWRDIARRMAEGEQPRTIAASLNLPEDRIWRHLNRSPKFLKDLRQATERQRLLAQLAFQSAGPAAALAQLGTPADADAARWLAEQTGLAGEGDLAGQLRESARSTRRAAAARPKASPAELAEHAALLALEAEMKARFAAQRAAAGTTNEAAKPGGPERTSANPDEPERIRMNLNEPERTGMSPDEPFRATPRPPAPPPRPPQRTVIDLDSPDLARLKAEGLLPP